MLEMLLLETSSLLEVRVQGGLFLNQVSGQAEPNLLEPLLSLSLRRIFHVSLLSISLQTVAALLSLENCVESFFVSLFPFFFPDQHVPHLQKPRGLFE